MVECDFAITWSLYYENIPTSIKWFDYKHLLNSVWLWSRMWLTINKKNNKKKKQETKQKTQTKTDKYFSLTEPQFADNLFIFSL